MPWNGSSPNQTFGRTDGTRTGDTTWQQAQAASVNIVADDHDTHDTDIADGLNLALKKDGGNKPTANIDWNSKKITSLADATADTDALNRQSGDARFAQLALSVVSKTQTDTPYTQLATDKGKMVEWDATSGACEYDLLAGATAGDGFRVYVQKTDSSANAVTIDPNGSELINGAATYVLRNQNEFVELFCDGTNWRVLSANGGLKLPTASAPAPTEEGQMMWDTDGDFLTIGDGSATKSIGTSRGDHQIWIPFSAFKPTQTNGAASASGTELATNDIVADGFDFDAATDEKLQFILRLPISWDHTSTIDGVIAWKTAATAGTGNVVWNLAALAIGNDDAMDAAFGTAGTVTDSFSVADDYMEAAITGVTPSGTPAASDAIVIQVSRDADNVSDTYTQDARFLGLMLTITTDQELDQ